MRKAFAALALALAATLGAVGPQPRSSGVRVRFGHPDIFPTGPDFAPTVPLVRRPRRSKRVQRLARAKLLAWKGGAR